MLMESVLLTGGLPGNTSGLLLWTIMNVRVVHHHGDYFLDGVERRPINLQNTVWDEIDCTNTCCRQNNPPWFHKQLPQASTDDIEMRVCRGQGRGDEDVGIKYVWTVSVCCCALVH
jgi:hypothetical protein